MIQGLGDMGFSLALSAVGSGLGAGIAGMAAIGAWKKVFMQNKAAPFMVLIFVGAPLTQTLYGMIVRNSILDAKLPPESYPFQMALGAAAGLAIGVSAWMQGAAAAKASDALVESGKGFAQYMMVLGIIETVALFVLAFVKMALPKI
ncbi:MAG: V-type ATP synthase subunit K [Candidatus Omnitrophota bacterium]